MGSRVGGGGGVARVLVVRRTSVVLIRLMLLARPWRACSPVVRVPRAWVGGEGFPFTGCSGAARCMIELLLSSRLCRVSFMAISRSSATSDTRPSLQLRFFVSGPADGGKASRGKLVATGVHSLLCPHLAAWFLVRLLRRVSFSIVGGTAPFEPGRGGQGSLSGHGSDRSGDGSLRV